jgi:hypothetical protein
LWLSKRGINGDGFDGELDTLAGGYISTGSTAIDVAKIEAMEGANVDISLLENLKSVGVISGIKELPQGIVPYEVNVFDLELPITFQPSCSNQEVEEFYLLTPKKVYEILGAQKLKFNAVPVVIDWMIRNSLFDIRSPDYLKLKQLIYR